jgi:hypothetical protein
MLKTIFVTYFSDRTNIANDCKIKRYAFNTESDVKIGDELKSKSYSSSMSVVEILDKAYTYYNNINGDLSNEITSTSMRKIKVLEIREEEDNIVYATKVEETK